MGRAMREIKKIIMHCSDSEWGSADVIDRWHKERGWTEIGYHYVITNGRRIDSRNYSQDYDGRIESGREVTKTGAHAKGHNADSIGVCLIGKSHFTAKQLYDALPTLLRLLLPQYELSPRDIYGHNEFDRDKTCPNFDVQLIRNLFTDTVTYVKPS